MRVLIFIAAIVGSMQCMDRNKDVAARLTHKLAYDTKDRLHKQTWDIEAQLWDFEWPERECCGCFRSPTFKAAVIGCCASVTTATIAAIVLLITQI